MISLSAAFTIMLLSLITGGCISAAYRNLRGFRGKSGLNHFGKKPFRGAIYGIIGGVAWFLDLVAIYLAVR